MILEKNSVTRITQAWRRSRLRIRLKKAVKALALRYRSCIVIQRVTRGWLGRIYAIWVKMDTVIKCIQRRWFYYKSRFRFVQIKNALKIPLLDLHAAETRLIENKMEIIHKDDSFWRLLWHGTTCKYNSKRMVFNFYSSSLLQTCFIAIVMYLLYSKTPKTSLFLTHINIYLTSFTTLYYTVFIISTFFRLTCRW